MADVPSELQRQFQLMRELDELSLKLQQEVDGDMLLQLKAAAERQQGKPRRVLRGGGGGGLAPA